MMPKIVSEPRSPFVLLTNLQNRNEEDIAESTGVVPAKYFLNVKLERISTTLECQSWENYVYLDL